MKRKYVPCNGIMQQVMYEEVQPKLKLQIKLFEASDRLQVSKMMSHSTQAVIGHAYLQIGPGGAERPCSCHADLVLYINSPAESA